MRGRWQSVFGWCRACQSPKQPPATSQKSLATIHEQYATHHTPQATSHRSHRKLPLIDTESVHARFGPQAHLNSRQTVPPTRSSAPGSASCMRCRSALVPRKQIARFASRRSGRLVPPETRLVGYRHVVRRDEGLLSTVPTSHHARLETVTVIASPKWPK